MSRPRIFQLFAAVAVAAVAVTLALQAAPTPAREIRLEARAMAFYLEGSDVPNPTLEARSGERIRLVLINADRGVQHDVRLPEWNKMTPLIDPGSTAVVTFDVPESPGEHPYDCTLHPQMMAGRLVVR